MTLELRPLKGDDLFLLLEIFKKLDVVDELTNLFTGAGVNAQDLKGKTKEELEEETAKIGVEVLGTLAKKALSNISQVKTELNALIANLTGGTDEQIKELSLLEYLNLVKGIFLDPQIKDFFFSFSTSTD